MRFAPILSLAAVLLLAAGASRAAVPPDEERVRLMALGRSVLRVEASLADGRLSLGSAVTVAPGQLVTNCHVTRRAREIHVIHAGLRHRAHAQRVDLHHDLCLLDVPGVTASSVAIGRSADLRRGSVIDAFGYTGGFGLQHSRGETVGLHAFDGAFVIQGSTDFSSGASGGGLFDNQGQLVGVLTFRLSGTERHYYSVPAEWVSSLLTGPPQLWSPVAPIAADVAAFWQARPDAQPPFLAAELLLHDGRWPELEAITGRWLRSDPRDPRAWALHGTALERQRRLPDARRALECSLALVPGDASARAWLDAVAAQETPAEQVQRRPLHGCRTP